jgi:anti-anti-sigma factor
MKLETRIHGKHAVICASGRLDVAWAEHFRGAVQEVIREGHHHVRIDADGLTFLSSAGIRAILRINRDLSALKGSFGFIRASAGIVDTLRLSGLEQLICPETEEAPDAVPAPAVAATPEVDEQCVPGIFFDKHSLAPQGRIVARTLGGWKPWQPVRPGDAVEIPFPRQVFGLGIGAAGRDVEDARTRFGEFVAAAGCLAWLPGDGTDTPDYLKQEARFVPRLQAIQAITGEGIFSHLMRFRPVEKGACLTLSDLYLQGFRATQSDAVAMVALAEVEGLVGTALARSPGLIQAGDRPGEFPEVRNWLAFCGDRVHRQSQALVVAFASRDPAHAAAPFLGPVLSRPEIRAHAHAVVMPFRSIPQGNLALDTAVQAVFEDSEPRGLLHLIEDDRPVIGLGQSAFIRGACWCAPLHFSTEAKS